MRGECPQASMKRMRSRVASRVVAVFTSGWQFTSAKSSSAASTTTITSAAAGWISANGVTEPAGTPSHRLEQLALGEAEPSGAEPLGERLEIDPRIVLSDDEHPVAVLVGKEQALGMGTGELVA
jgi:hypothetical protein